LVPKNENVFKSSARAGARAAVLAIACGAEQAKQSSILLFCSFDAEGQTDIQGGVPPN